VEIDENLMRAKLTELERALSLKSRKRIYPALHPERAPVTPRRSRPRKTWPGQATVLPLPTKPASARYLRPIDPAIDTNRGRRHPQAAEWLGPTPVAHSRADLIRLARMPAPTRHRVPYGPGRSRQHQISAPEFSLASRRRAAVRTANGIARPPFSRATSHSTVLVCPTRRATWSLPISCAPNGSTLRGVSRPDTSCPSGGEVRRARPRMRYRAERK
jgi:hypothetical protein